MKKEIFIENGEIIIKIACTPRQHAIDQRSLVVFDRDVLSMIPKEYEGKIKLQESPSRPVSNLLKKGKYVHTGVWRFKIIEKEKKTQPRKTRRKSSTSRTKSATMVKVENKVKSTN